MQVMHGKKKLLKQIIDISLHDSFQASKHRKKKEGKKNKLHLDASFFFF